MTTFQVKFWITFNEPSVFCWHGYGSGEHAPGITEPGTAFYIASHTVIKAHARAYRTYEELFRKTQNGRKMKNDVCSKDKAMKMCTKVSTNKPNNKKNEIKQTTTKTKAKLYVHGEMKVIGTLFVIYLFIHFNNQLSLRLNGGCCLRFLTLR